MSTTIHAAMDNSMNKAFDEKQKRAYAVATALEVIAASVSHSSDANQLTAAMGNLSAYADEIQKALGAK
ncbi:hypothetical protein [Pseudomonas poae]|uniref:DUF3077 domain-containing protein n=1 Tax=Pseudomonas poae TaxID=200451 RepID=A0ABY0RBY9_9PSED|nr:hypothetical protein [Pseudomonas poae]KRP44073.1 hypothetical protein TU75_22610 [Pseudomonas poae]SDN50728.1 hypothetical protein SAMN04490208_0531 [Pseudomonas poae]